MASHSLTSSPAGPRAFSSQGFRPRVSWRAVMVVAYFTQYDFAPPEYCVFHVNYGGGYSQYDLVSSRVLRIMASVMVGNLIQSICVCCGGSWRSVMAAAIPSEYSVDVSEVCNFVSPEYCVSHASVMVVAFIVYDIVSSRVLRISSHVWWWQSHPEYSSTRRLLAASVHSRYTSLGHGVALRRLTILVVRPGGRHPKPLNSCSRLAVLWYCCVVSR